MKSILLTGHSGFIGEFLHKQLSKDFAIFTSNKDITTNEYFEEIAKFEFDTIINCAAFTKLDCCENNKERAYDVNVTALAKLLNLYKDKKFIHFSTDQVFDGLSKTIFNVDDYLNPICYYSFTKCVQEALIKSAIKNYVLIRTSRVYGNMASKKANGFNWIVQQIKEKDEIDAFSNLYQRPTHVNTILDFIYETISEDLVGTFHVVGKDIANRVDIAKAVSRVLNKKITIIASRTNFARDSNSDKNDYCFVLSDNEKNSRVGVGLDEGIKLCL